MNKILTLLFCLILASCSTVTISPSNGGKISSPPAYESSEPFFISGLIGEARVNTSSICGDREVLQMQSQQTFIEGFVSGLTLGLYSPHTVKVWCK